MPEILDVQSLKILLRVVTQIKGKGANTLERKWQSPEARSLYKYSIVDFNHVLIIFP